jgi:uncharacterized cofD-like protein
MTRVVAVGGGHGLAATLRAVRRYADEVVGIVSVADDGGSSGRLRDAIGVAAPGDLRRCLATLADDSLFAQAFSHRFAGGELDGHALGNLVLAAMADVSGDLVRAAGEAARLLGVDATILPATSAAVTLVGTTDTGRSVIGQVAVQETDGISRVSLDPPDAAAPPEAVAALEEADQIVIGPGSLYTSVLAALSVPALREAFGRTKARTAYVCNLRPQAPETNGYDVAAHVAALRRHGIDPDVVVVHPRSLPLGDVDTGLCERPVARPNGLVHDPVALSEALEGLL